MEFKLVGLVISCIDNSVCGDQSKGVQLMNPIKPDGVRLCVWTGNVFCACYVRGDRSKLVSLTIEYFHISRLQIENLE